MCCHGTEEGSRWRGIHVFGELITANNGKQIKSRFGPIGELSHWSNTKSIYKISLGLCYVCVCVGGVSGN